MAVLSTEEGTGKFGWMRFPVTALNPACHIVNVVMLVGEVVTVATARTWAFSAVSSLVYC